MAGFHMYGKVKCEEAWIPIGYNSLGLTNEVEAMGVEINATLIRLEVCVLSVVAV